MAGFRQEYLGPIEYFDGAMAAIKTRKVKVIRIVEDAAFTVLTMKYPALPATVGAANPSALSFPATFEIWDVNTFQLASGSIQVVYDT